MCVDTSILDLSKRTMIKFHYDMIHKSFEGRYNLIYSDTESLVFNRQRDNIYQWIKQKKTHVDLSDSVRDDLKVDLNTNVIGQFKDETNSLPIIETTAEAKMLLFQSLKE